MASFYKAIPHIFRWEGGFVDHPADPAGATNMGITFGTFKTHAKSLLGVEPTLENLKALTKEQASIIYKIRYWNKIKGRQIQDQGVAEVLFDAFVNKGFNGTKLMQKTLNLDHGESLVVDGLIGNKSLKAINSANPHKLKENFLDRRVDYYQRLVKRRPQMKVFLKGWLNRINSYR